jgi:hypothetical protein
VRNGSRQLTVNASRHGFDVKLSATFSNAHRARSARGRQCRLECPRLEIDLVRRQLGHTVRDDRAGEVDGLAASAAESKVSYPSQRVFEYLEHQV